MELSSSLASNLQKLYARASHHVVKLGLETETALLDSLGHPELRMPHVHVAGTNGKGSVCAMIESVLRAGGYKTGLYTSPHLVRFNERIRVAGRCITDGELAALFPVVDEHDRRLAAKPGGRATTFFEFATALAMEHFKRSGVEIAVLETGLGGRLDATNVAVPLVSVITRIDIEHTQYLGTTIEEIAAEKGGIIKPGRAVICGAMPAEARGVIARIAADRRANVLCAEQAISIRRMGQDLDGQRIKIEATSGSCGPLVFPLLGKYQLENVATAVAALEYLCDASPFVCREENMRQGLETVRWPARCQVLSQEPPVILDVAHNPNAAKALADTLKELTKGRELGLVVGLLADKDARGFASALAPLVKKCWAVPIQNERAMPVDQLVACLRAEEIEAEAHPLDEALAQAKEWAGGRKGAVCIAGSLFLAGEVLGREGGELYG